MQYFSIETIKSSIESLQDVKANWLIPAFVFAANGVGTEEFVDISRRLGTDQFLDRYFNGNLIGIPPFESGNNLLRPRLKGINWNRGRFANDYVIRQDTRMWGNLFSSRGYREMRLSGYLEGEKTTFRLTDEFQGALEAQIPGTFEFEDFLVWLFAFSGFPRDVNSWRELFSHLLRKHLHLDNFQTQYRGRFTLGEGRNWPETTNDRPSNEQFFAELAPRLLESFEDQQAQMAEAANLQTEYDGPLAPDDAVLARIRSAINMRTSYTFLLAGPPGTGKTKYAHEIADYLAEGDQERVLFLQFHPTFGYDDFVEGFRPSVREEGSTSSDGAIYALEQRHFLQFADRARGDPSRKYVLVIDELNRGDVARIFGELLTYLELEYREKEFTLAISGETISVPQNIILLATANPFDRAVTDLDDALLRRFLVISLNPDKTFLQAYLKSRNVEKRVRKRTLGLFDILNEALPQGFGHTNFLRVTTIEDLAEVWNGRVQLGLQRALFHDPNKLQAIQNEVDQLLKLDETAEVEHDEESDQ